MVKTLEEFTAVELRHYLASLQERGLVENSVKHPSDGQGFANWAAREGHPADVGRSASTNSPCRSKRESSD